MHLGQMSNKQKKKKKLDGAGETLSQHLKLIV